MTSPSPSDPAATAVELERIRRSIDVGFTRTDGTLALLVQRHDATDRHLGAHDAQLEQHDARLDVIERAETERQKRDAARLDAVERGETERQRRNDGRLDALEERRIPWRQVAAGFAVLAAVLGAVQFFAQQLATQ